MVDRNTREKLKCAGDEIVVIADAAYRRIRIKAWNNGMGSNHS